MTQDTAQQLADMANKAEAEILEQMTVEMKAWYLTLDREKRVAIAFAAAKAAAKSLN